LEKDLTFPETRQCDNQSPEDGSTDNSRNVVYIEYASHNMQCLTNNGIINQSFSHSLWSKNFHSWFMLKKDPMWIITI